MAQFTVPVPDLGEFEDIEVIEILVAVGQRVERDTPLLTVESDKASAELPSPRAGSVQQILVAVGDRVVTGTPVVTLEVEGEEADEAERPGRSALPAAAEKPRAPAVGGAAERHTEVVVLGAGPGGYTAAFRAADLGKGVVLVERHATLGGVCLNVGCIPSKALLHVAAVMEEVRDLDGQGVAYGAPRIDLGRLRSHKDGVVGTLTGGLAQLAKRRSVQIARGSARFATPNLLEIETEGRVERLSFDAAIVAVGSRSVTLPDFPHEDPRVMDSTQALQLDDIPETLLVVGGGIIGLEIATVYRALGSEVTVVEVLDDLMAGVDADLLRPLQKRLRARSVRLFPRTRVTGLRAEEDGLWASLEGQEAPPTARFDRVLVAVGRRPNGDRICAERAGLRVDERGFLAVDAQQRTSVPHIYAIGDVAGPPLLAHKATHEGKTAAEVIAGLPAAFDRRAIPSVAYTDPEIAWAGLSEAEAAKQGVEVQIAKFPWAANGRALGAGRGEGLTKLLFAPGGGDLLGAGIVGAGAGELIAEAVLALELGADAEDIGLTIHPHPTLSETLAGAAEIATGTITDLYFPPRKRKREP